MRALRVLLVLIVAAILSYGIFTEEGRQILGMFCLGVLAVVSFISWMIASARAIDEEGH